jgi:soluble lytic murein transglycosylase-like protein
VRAVFLFLLLCCTAGRAQPTCSAGPGTASLDVEMCWADYYARTFGVPLEFVQAVIDVESAWHPYVISTKGAAGLMQLTAPTAYTFGVTNRFRVEENIRGGVAYLAYLSRQFEGELRLVAAAYYAGEQRIKKRGLTCADADIYRYVCLVQRFYSRRQMVAKTTARYSTKGAEHQ